MPYAGAGLGIYRVSAKVSVPGLVNTSASATSAYLTLSGGLRYYVGENWGVRPDITIYAGRGSFAQAAAGVFYQF